MSGAVSRNITRVQKSAFQSTAQLISRPVSQPIPQNRWDSRVVQVQPTGTTTSQHLHLHIYQNM